MSNIVVNIFWTAGWDSTFRVIDLVLVKKRIVQPYYVIDKQRKSSTIEQKRINQMRDMMITIDPTVVERLLDIKAVFKDEIPENKDLEKRFYDLRAAGGFIGSQYVFLANFAEYVGVNDMEMCIHKDDKAHDYLQNDVVSFEEYSDLNYNLAPDLSNSDLSIFKYFRFPLFEMTKLEMQNYAINNGFQHIMEETWFCHHPYKDDIPCGLCNPCVYTRDEGLERRVPNPSPLRKFKYKTRINTLIILSRIKRMFIK